MNSLQAILVSLIAMTLIGCEKTGDKTPPVVSQIYSRITHFHPDYWAKAGETVRTRLAVSFEFRVDDPDGFKDINTIDITDNTSEQTFNIVTRLSSEDWGVYYQTAPDVFLVEYLSPLNSNRVELTNWQLNAKDLQGDSLSRGFSFSLPDGEDLLDELFVYSPEYSGVTTDGIEALEVMTIADNQLSIAYDSDSGHLTVQFRVTDSRAKSYAVWFYTANPNVKPVALVDFDSLASSTLNNTGDITTLTVSQADIEMGTISDITQIKGAHVVLSDAPVELPLVTDGQWVNYEGVSEYFTMP